jgi:hypothetical protein
MVRFSLLGRALSGVAFVECVGVASPAPMLSSARGGGTIRVLLPPLDDASAPLLPPPLPERARRGMLPDARADDVDVANTRSGGLPELSELDARLLDGVTDGLSNTLAMAAENCNTLVRDLSAIRMVGVCDTWMTRALSTGGSGSDDRRPLGRRLTRCATAPDDWCSSSGRGVSLGGSKSGIGTMLSRDPDLLDESKQVADAVVPSRLSSVSPLIARTGTSIDDCELRDADDNVLSLEHLPAVVAANEVEPAASAAVSSIRRCTSVGARDGLADAEMVGAEDDESVDESDDDDVVVVVVEDEHSAADEDASMVLLVAAVVLSDE